jgi:hypothetical protein
VNVALAALALGAGLLLVGCEDTQSSDAVQRQASEKLLAEGTAQAGMPAIKNFRERKLMKDILELRDQDGLLTYTYVFAEHSGELKFVGESIGYALPYSAQYTNPEKPIENGTDGIATLPQADPNGLFSPGSAEGSWVMLKDPKSKKVAPVYFEPRVVVSPFRLH